MIVYKESIPKLKEDKRNIRYCESLVDRHEMLVWLMGYMFSLVSIKFIKYTDLNKPLTTIYLSVGRVNPPRMSSDNDVRASPAADLIKRSRGDRRDNREVVGRPNHTREFF